MASPETVDATGRRWILPYRRIERILEEKGSVRVLLPGEGEATDLQVWAHSRGYRVVRSLRTAVGMEVVLEAPRAKPEERPAPARAPAPGRPTSPAAGGARPAPRGPVRVEAGSDLDKVSQRMEDPLFRVDLLLASLSTRQGELRGPTSVEALAKLAAETAGPGQCAHVEASHESGARIELLVCQGRVEGLVAEAGDAKARGGEALNLASRVLESGRVTYRVRVVPREFVEKLRQ